MTARKLLPLASLLCLLALTPATAGAATKTETASSGDVTATLTYNLTKDEYGATNVRLKIVRGGTTVLTGSDVTKGCVSCKYATPLGGLEGSKEKSLTITAVDGSTEPTVLVDLFTGGAHCCSVTALYSFRASSSTYSKVVRNWGDGGYVLKDLDGKGPEEFVTDDDYFAYRFCAYACSLRPIKILHFTGSAFTDVSKDYPEELAGEAADARKLYEDARKGPKDERFAIKGILPAYCADVYRLGDGKDCTALLNLALKRGDLDKSPGDFVKSGKAYIADLMGFLKRRGYIS